VLRISPREVSGVNPSHHTASIGMLCGGPDETECYDLRPGHEQRLNVSTPRYLRVRRLEALT
jgi:hypothetical protein